MLQISFDFQSELINHLNTYFQTKALKVDELLLKLKG